MKLITPPNEIDLNDFSENKENPHVLYGLPKEIYYCKKCVISNQRPNSAIEYEHTKETKKKTINFNDDGICDACKYAELKNNSNYDDSTGPNNDTVLLKYQNPLISGRTGSIEYNITYGV